MEKNDQVKRLKEDFDKFNGPKVDSMEDTIKILVDYYDEVASNRWALQQQKNGNERGKRISSVLVKIPFIRVNKTPEFFDKDNDDMDTEIGICTDFMHYYDRLYEEVSSVSYEEVAKLAGFCNKIYSLNYFAIESNRMSRENACYGGDYSPSYCTFDSEDFGEFLNGEIEKINKPSLGKVFGKLKK